MRNLRNINHTQIDFPADHLPLSSSTWDTDNVALVCTFGPSPTDSTIQVKRFSQDAYRPEDGKLIASWNAPCPSPDLECDKVLCTKYLPETQAICLILAGGDMILVREAPNGDEEPIEIIGSVDSGIKTATWSPDDELMAICTGSETVILMTRLFESTANVSLSPEDVQVSAHVSVGWGKSETQFKGKRAKALVDPTMPEHIDEGTLSEYDDGKSTITWRGDGAYFALNHLGQDRRRMIRVFTREGVLDSVSEPVDGLESALSWRPAGNLIAGIQYKTSKGVDVVFFERNGLRHGQFSLRLDEMARPPWAQKISLEWNIDSTVLAVSFCDRVQLWTMGNYHYYLKQEILLTEARLPAEVKWHPENALQFSVSAMNSLFDLTYHLHVASGGTLPPKDIGLVAVIDGKNLKLTPLRIANVPPPMAHLEIQAEHNIRDIWIDVTSSMIAVLFAVHLNIYNLDMNDIDQPKAVIGHTMELNTLSSNETCRQAVIDQNGEVSILLNVSNSKASRILTIRPDDVKKSDSPLCNSIFANSTGDCMYQDRNDKTGSIVEILSQKPSHTVPVKFPAFCPKIEVWSSDPENGEIVFGLASGGLLRGYSNIAGRQVIQIKNVTSFLIIPTHLIYTTTQHLIKFIHLSHEELEEPQDEPEKDERCRSIERGARLITAIPSAYSVVLQMPRGNLETIYPRALVLAGIRKAINEKNYRRAFFACRNHRVDMNILHDYAPKQFLTCVGIFIDQIKKSTHIDLFLSQLKEEDVAQTMYKDTLDIDDHPVEANVESKKVTTNSDGPNLLTRTSKINRICDAFLLNLQGREDTHLQNIVTSHVCKSPPDLESGLRLVAKLRSQDTKSADQAVEHICFLADVNRLYDTALGIYELEVALLVAQQSQKDPREYVPYMQSLQEMPELRRKFTIDDDLKRYSKALGHLFSLDKFGEFKAYTVKHELYPAALDYYKYQSSRLEEIMRTYADFLLKSHRPGEAGIAYEFLSDYQSACEAYKSANMWRESLSSAHLEGSRSDDEIRSLAQSLASGLVEGKDYASAAEIYTTQLGDIENAARYLCKAYKFSEAVTLISAHKRPELLKTIIDAGLVECFTISSELLAEMKGQINAQIPRIRELRLKKEQDPCMLYSSYSPLFSVHHY